MDPISNVDRLVLILRQRLAESSGKAKAGRKDAGRPARSAANPADAIRAIAATGSATDRELKRALVQTLLADHFGQELVNDARFQQVVDRVQASLDQDPDLAVLFDRVLGDLKAG